MASSDEETLHILESLINEFYSGSTSNERKRELEIMLNSFSARSDSVDYCLRFLTVSRSEFTIMYCLSVIESAMNRAPGSGSLSFSTTSMTTLGNNLSTTSVTPLGNYHLSMKSILMKYLLTGYHVLPPFIANKTAKLVVGIGKMCFPSSDPEFLNDIYALIQVKESCSIGLLLLQILLEEFTLIKEGDLCSSRKAELHKLLIGQSPTILNLITSVIEATIDKHILSETTATPPPSPTHHFGQPGTSSDSLLMNAFQLGLQKGIFRSNGKMSPESARISNQSLNCLLSLFSWNSFHDVNIVNESLMAAIFLLATFGFHTSTSSTGHGINYSDMVHLATLAMDCINELIGKHVILTGSSDFISNLFTNSFNLLQSLIREQSDACGKNIDPQYISKFTEFLKIFLGNHFSRFESHPNFPLSEFMNCLFHFSFSPSSSPRLFSCLELWNIFLDVILEKRRSIREEDSSNMFMDKYKSILITLLNEISLKMQFKYNATYLESLKDENDELLDGEDEMIESDEIITMSNERRFINYCIEVISKIGQVIPLDCFNTLSGIFFENLSLYADLQYFMVKSVQIEREGKCANISSGGHDGLNIETRKSHYSFQDFNSSLQGIGRFNIYFTHEFFEERYSIARNFIDKLHQTLIYTNRFKLSSIECDALLNSDLIQIHSQILATLGAYTYWFLQLSSSESESRKTDFNYLMNSLIQECVNLIIPPDDKDCLMKTSSITQSTSPTCVSTTPPFVSTTLPFVSTTPTSVIHASLQLLSSIQETCRPQILLNSVSFHSLLKKSMTLCSFSCNISSNPDQVNMKGLRLPITREDEYVLIVFLSKSILVPWTHVCDSSQEWTNRSLTHDLLVKSITEPIKSAALQTLAPSLVPSTVVTSTRAMCGEEELVNCIRRFLPLFTTMIGSHSESPSRSKQLLHSSITEISSICGSLLNSCLSHPVIGSHLFDFFLTIFDVLRSQVKKDFIQNIVSIVLNVFSSSKDSTNVTNSDNKKPESNPSTLLLEKLFKMLTFVVQQPMLTGMKSSLLSPIITLVIDQIGPHLMNNLLQLSSSDLLKSFFEFLHQLLLNNLKYFFKNDVSSRGGNDEMQSEYQFLSIMKMYGSAFVSLSNDIPLFKFNLHSMQILNVKFKLFSKDIFLRRFSLWNSFLTCFLSTLTQSNNGKQSSCNLLMDELIGIIYTLSLVDDSSFHSFLLPDFIHNQLGSQVTTNQKHKLANHDFVIKSFTDLPSFSLALIQFSNDVKYYRKITCNNSSTASSFATFTSNNSSPSN